MTGRAVLAAMGLGALLLTVGTVAAAGRDAGGPEGRPVPGAVRLLQDEIDAMVDRGLLPDHPKAEMLRAEVEALLEATSRDPMPEAGIEPRAGGEPPASSPEEAARQAGERRPEQPAERAVVECEVVPHLLGPEEIAGATCLSLPQADGTSRYVAVSPQGAVRIVHFGPDRVTRLADRRLPPGLPPDGVELVPGDEGDVRVVARGETVARLAVE